jgi:hypothetical protein
MINTREEFFNVAFQNPDRPGVIAALFPRHCPKTVQRPMCSFSKRQGKESLIKVLSKKG